MEQPSSQGQRLTGFVRHWCEKAVLETHAGMRGSGACCAGACPCLQGQTPASTPCSPQNPAGTWQRGKQQVSAPLFASSPPRAVPGTRQHGSAATLPPHPILPHIITIPLHCHSPVASKSSSSGSERLKGYKWSGCRSSFLPSPSRSRSHHISS